MPALIYDESISAFKEAAPPMIWAQGNADIQPNTYYTLHGVENGQVFCLDSNGTNALMISTTPIKIREAWPGAGDLGSSYFGSAFSQAISNVYLFRFISDTTASSTVYGLNGTFENNTLAFNTIYAALAKYIGVYSYYGFWSGTAYSTSNSHWFQTRTEFYPEYNWRANSDNQPQGIAPTFHLNLFKVRISNSVIYPQ